MSLAGIQSAARSLATPAVVAILGVPFLVFLACLDAYPLPFIDEPFFYGPAVNYLTGQGFLYQMSEQVPYSDLVFACHAPFQPRLQVLAFALFGFHSFAARISNFLAAYLAIGVLSAFLLRRQLRAAALLQAIAWVSSPVLTEVLFARMEGLALLGLALGAIGLIRTLESGSARLAFASGLALGTACGFHPLCVTFAGAGALLILGLSVDADRPRFRWPGRLAWQRLAAYSIGGLLPALLVVWLWTPFLREAILQFRWACQFQLDRGRLGALFALIQELSWRGYWLVGLLGLTAGLPLAGRLVLSGERPKLAPGALVPWIVAATFSMAGLMTLLRSLMHRYYLTYFAPWPVLALGLLLSGLTANHPALRRATVALGLVFLVSLGPGFRSNILRARVAIGERAALDRSVFAGRLATLVPPGAPVTGSPDMILIARRAGLNFTPLSWFAGSAVLRPETWVILTDWHRYEAPMVDPRSLAGRPIVYEGPAFPASKLLGYPVTIFGPEAHPAQDRRE